MSQNNSKKTEQLSIQEILSKDNYVIPIYQRDYAWRNNEITQLIQDVADFTKNKKENDYYIGTLVAYERIVDGKPQYEIIDGQQRFTTIVILLSVIRNEYDGYNIDIDRLNLAFDCREKSTKALSSIFENSTKVGDENTMIIQGYDDAKKALARILNEYNLGINDFAKYLFEKVKILRVLVPIDTDLNHYFEVMNTRGEQLEKHEILKSKCLNDLDEKDRIAFNMAWEACADMEKYVQYKYDSNLRKSIFGEDLNHLVEIDAYYNTLAPKNNESANTNPQEHLTIEKILTGNSVSPSDNNNDDDKNVERFNTIINFSNFLLHVLRVQMGKDIPLDDKRLLDTFDLLLKSENKKENIRIFGYNLLKCKFLLDKYIIKREYIGNKDEWSLKHLKVGTNLYYANTFGEEDNEDKNAKSINRKILMILSMFHVSAPTLIYKHWLNAALKYLFENDEVDAVKYYNYLFEMAKRFMKYRFLAEHTCEYYEMIYSWDGNKDVDINYNKLDNGTNVENFIFNFTDYLLWLEAENADSECFKTLNKNNVEAIITVEKIKKFEFTFRSSVEHYYPQNPIDGNPIDKKMCDNFGNLCLIDGGKNSRLNNHLPSAKKDYYIKSESIDSIKQYIMMEYEEWDIDGDNKINEIEHHEKKMKSLLQKYLTDIIK